MGFREIIAKIGQRSKERKALLKQMEEQARLQRIVEERQKSSNERELERFMEEDRQEQIKEALEVMRKKRDEDIRFGHNPLDTPNITNHAQWEVLKERNQFAGRGNMFVNQKSILKNNHNLFRNNKNLFKI